MHMRHIVSRVNMAQHVVDGSLLHTCISHVTHMKGTTHTLEGEGKLSTLECFTSHTLIVHATHTPIPTYPNTFSSMTALVFGFFWLECLLYIFVCDTSLFITENSVVIIL